MAASKNRHARRRLLQGITASALAYPFVRALPSSAGGHPKRILFFYSPNNSMDTQYWRPDGEGSEFALPELLPPMLEALNPYRENLLIIGNMEMHTRYKESGPGGHVGMGHQLTGCVNSLWPNLKTENDYWGGGISLDQYIANELGTEALTLGARPYGTSGGSRISYKGIDEPVDPWEDPGAAFSAMFGNPDLGNDEQLAHNQRQVRAIDRVAAELDKLKGRLPQDDRAKLEIHLEHLLKLEDDLVAFNPATCDPTAPEADDGWMSALYYPETGRRHMDVLAQAVACGITRVGSIQNGNTGNAENYNGVTDWPSEGIYIDRSQHVVAHDFDLDPETHYEARLQIEQFYVRQYAYLLGKLREIPEGDGTVLDNTLVVWTKGMGRDHSSDHLLYLVAGGTGFPDLNPGRYIDRTGVPHNNLLVTLANLMDLPIDTFGDPEICSGPVAL